MAKPKDSQTLTELCLESGSETQAQIARIVDEHIQWLLAFNRLAFYGDTQVGAAAAIAAAGKDKPASPLPLPKTFINWFRGQATRQTADQPVIDRLAVQHDQLHKLAKMMLQKAGDGADSTMPALDYELVLTRYSDFMQALRRYEQQASAAGAGLDRLTGLRSRQGLAADLAAEQKRMARAGGPEAQPLAVVFGSLDRFGELAALHGGETTDRALMQMAEAILATVRTYDEAYRIDGASFLVCLKGATAVQAQTVMERVLQKIAGTPVRLFGGGQLAATASFGIAESGADEPLADLLARAEGALSTAQQTGNSALLADA